MASRSEDVPDEALDQIEHGLDAYFAGDTARRLLEAIDWEAFTEKTAVEEPVDYEQLGEVLGRLVARTIVNDLSRRGLLGQFIETTIGQEIGGHLGGTAVEAFIKSGAPEAIGDLGEDITAATRDLGVQHVLTDRHPNASEWDDATTIDIEHESDDKTPGDHH